MFVVARLVSVCYRAAAEHTLVGHRDTMAAVALVVSPTEAERAEAAGTKMVVVIATMVVDTNSYDGFLPYKMREKVDNT